MSKTKRDSKLIDQRQQEQKKLIVDQLRKIPIVQVACEKNGVSRATYYRWVNDDATFATETEEAIREGTAFINDMAESQLITLVKDQNFPAISFWLRNRHKAYTNRLEVSVEPKQEMTEEQKEMIERSFLHSGLTQTTTTPYAQPDTGSADAKPDPQQQDSSDHTDDKVA